MDSKNTLASLRARSSSMLSLLENSSGKLQRQLRKGEFAMFKHMPMFESDFVQVSKRGYVIDVHNSVQMVTVGITFSSPDLPMPDVMLLARPTGGHAASARRDPATRGKRLKSAKSLELTRLFPLKFVNVSIFSREKKQLRLKLATGRSFYLQLCPVVDAKEDEFAQWEDVVLLLRPSMEISSSMQTESASDIMDLPVLEAEDKSIPEALEVHGKGQLDQVSTGSLPMYTSSAYTAEEGEVVQSPAPGTFCVFVDTELVVPLAPTGSDQRATPGAAETPLGSRGVVTGGNTTITHGTQISEGPGVGPSVTALSRRGNTSEKGGAHRASQPEAEAPRKQKKEDAPGRKPSHSGQKREDKSALRSHGTTRGHQKAKGVNRLSNTRTGSQLSQKSRSLSKSTSVGAP